MASGLSFSVVRLLKQVTERKELEGMYARWLDPKQLQGERSMLPIHYIDALKNDRKRATIVKSLSKEAYALLAVLVRCPQERREVNPEFPYSPLELQKSQPGEFIMAPLSLVLARAISYAPGVNLGHVAELHSCGAAYFERPEYWPPALLPCDREDPVLVLAPFFTAGELPLPERASEAVPLTRDFVPVRREYNTATFRRLDDFLSYCEHHLVRYNRTQNRFYASSLEALSRILPETKEPVAEYFLRFGLDSGLLHMDSRGWLCPTRELSSFRLSPEAEQICAYLKWRVACPEIMVDRPSTPGERCLENHFKTRMPQVLQENREGWTSLDALLETCYRRLSSAYEQGSPSDSGRLLAETRPVPSFLDAKKYFAERLEPKLIGNGLCEFGYDGEDRAYFKLSALGLYRDGLGPLPVFDSSKSQLIVKNDFEIVLINSGPFDGQRHFLELFAEKDPVSTYATSVFHLNQKCLQDANGAGRPIGMLIDFLRERAAVPVPENVISTLEEWVTSEVVLRKDSCFFTFDTKEEADRLFQKIPGRFTRAGDRILLCSMGEAAIQKLIASTHLKAVDYSIPPSGTLTITQEEEIVFGPGSDLRNTYLARFADTRQDPDGTRRYFLSREKLKAIDSPKLFYLEIAPLFTNDTSLLTKLRLLRHLGVVPPAGPVTVLGNCPAATRQQLQKIISWPRCICIQIAPSQYAVRDGFESEVAGALQKLPDRRCVLQNFPIL